jgi:hypothetical protein
MEGAGRGSGCVEMSNTSYLVKNLFLESVECEGTRHVPRRLVACSVVRVLFVFM